MAAASIVLGISVEVLYKPDDLKRSWQYLGSLRDA